MGFPVAATGQGPPTTNVRKTTSNFWKPWLEPERRCLMPVTSFCEYDWRSGKAVPAWFALEKEPATGDHLLFAFLTTASPTPK